MEFYEVVKQILLVSFRLISKFNKTLLRILLCLVCEFHRQFSSLFDISRISLHCMYSFFSQDFTIQINTINFFLKFQFEFNLNLVCNDFCQVCCHSEINFLCSTFISPMIILTLSCTLVLISARSSCIWFDTSELLFLWIIFCLDFLISKCTEFRLRCSPQFFIFFIPFLVFHHVLQ